jgi:sensor histidine kinase regulating citrate/malate metabolism
MKTANPPVKVIRNPMFNTDVNKLIQFVVDNIFRRVYREGDQYIFDIRLDHTCPKIHINEYVAWEIFEPLINNAIEHNKKQKTTITITTEYVAKNKHIILEISDDGLGIEPDFLEKGNNGIQKIFSEKVTIKELSENAGYGCYIAYENCRRCGWNIYAGNKEQGAKFNIEIPVS